MYGMFVLRTGANKQGSLMTNQDVRRRFPLFPHSPPMLPRAKTPPPPRRGRGLALLVALGLSLSLAAAEKKQKANEVAPPPPPPNQGQSSSSSESQESASREVGGSDARGGNKGVQQVVDGGLTKGANAIYNGPDGGGGGVVLPPPESAPPPPPPSSSSSRGGLVSTGGGGGPGCPRLTHCLACCLDAKPGKVGGNVLKTKYTCHVLNYFMNRNAVAADLLSPARSQALSG